MSMVFHNQAKAALMGGSINLATATVKIMALNAYTILPGTQNFINQVSSAQITATGYTAGGQALANKAVTRDNATNRTWFDSDNPKWTITGTMAAQVFVLYVDTGNAATSPILATIDKGSPQSRTDADYELLVQTNGWFAL